MPSQSKAETGIPRSVRPVSPAPIPFEDRAVFGIIYEEHGHFYIRPTSKKIRGKPLVVNPENLKIGDLVKGSIDRSDNFVVQEKIDPLKDMPTYSWLAVQDHQIPHKFPQEVIDEAEHLPEAKLADRVDLRHIPLVTIDGAKARDFDDAVFAEPDLEEEGGWHLIVAIADVSHYVKVDSPLDREARERGNSVYFPDRVVPMLPERLSNDLCSLRPDGDRACLAVHMWIDRYGELRRHKFIRALMRSHARLTYEEVQDAQDHFAEVPKDSILKKILPNLYGAYQVLLKARHKRGTLEFDLHEYEVDLSSDGRVEKIRVRTRVDSHRLIEEMMICANVAAARFIHEANAPSLYRVHEQPALDSMLSLREFLKKFGIEIPKSNEIKPAIFKKILDQVKDKPYERLMHHVVLRSQTQAFYGPHIPEEAAYSHFGLALPLYTHFTSPIRRYADLIVHRTICQILGLSKDNYNIQKLEQIGQHISMTERRASNAERDVMERYMAEFYVPQIGEEFMARITGVSRFGMFVALDGTGAEGLIPLRTMNQDFFVFREEEHKLVGKRTKITYQLGDSIKVLLVEANQISGGLRFELVPATKNGGFVHGKNKKPFQKKRR